MFMAEELRKEPCPFARALIRRRVRTPDHPRLFDFGLLGLASCHVGFGSVVSRRSRTAWADAVSSPKADSTVGLS